MKAANRHPRGDIDDGGILLPVLGVPSAGLEIDRVHDLRIEQFIQAARNATRHGHAIKKICVLRMLAADVHFAGRCADRAGHRLLNDLRRRGRGCAVRSLLRVRLVAGTRIDGDWRRGVDLHRRQRYGRLHQRNVEHRRRFAIDDNGARHRREADKTHPHEVRAVIEIVHDVAPECVGLCCRHHLAVPAHANFSGTNRGMRRAVGHDTAKICMYDCRGCALKRQERQQGDRARERAKPGCGYHWNTVSRLDE